MLQDSDSPTGTFVNGNRISEPTFLNLGDVITLGTGSKAPALEVDPLGVGRATAPPVRNPARVESPHPPQPSAAPGQPPAFAASDDSGFFQQGDAEAGWPAGAATTTTVPHRRPQSKQAGSMVGLAVGCVAAVLLGGGLLIYFVANKAQAPATPKPAPTGGGGRGSDVFSMATTKPAKPRKPSSRTIASAGKPRSTPEPEDNGTEPGDPATTVPVTGIESNAELWSLVGGRAPAPAINGAERFLYSHPKTPLKPDIDKFVADEYRTLWWDRITKLVKARQIHQDQIDEIKPKIEGASDAAFIREQTTLLKHEQELFDKYNKILTDDFGYTSTQIPSFETTQTIPEDLQPKYQEWKRQVRALIVKTQGEPYGPLP